MKPKIERPLVIPDRELVEAACDQVDRDNSITEQALTDLFGQYPVNTNHPHVLLKVVALNRLYSTNILSVHDVANHIYQYSQDVDSALAIGSPNVVDLIAKVTITTTGKVRANYSFATKYCSWHYNTAYPIWDTRVYRYLRSLRRTSSESFLGTKSYFWDEYPEFVQLMTAFRDRYKLNPLTFKQIDKFLYQHGGGS
jgi:hypothetical protein